MGHAGRGRQVAPPVRGPLRHRPAESRHQVQRVRLDLGADSGGLFLPRLRRVFVAAHRVVACMYSCAFRPHHRADACDVLHGPRHHPPARTSVVDPRVAGEGRRGHWFEGAAGRSAQGHLVRRRRSRAHGRAGAKGLLVVSVLPHDPAAPGQALQGLQLLCAPGRPPLPIPQYLRRPAQLHVLLRLRGGIGRLGRGLRLRRPALVGFGGAQAVLGRAGHLLPG
mmetsp:Transcript_23194/g.69656  ORF Transcript_23194/g.69656 Transcript_23194/m.69656 type:complete len:223 (-) Transcript_23194:459-1127(-)